MGLRMLHLLLVINAFDVTKEKLIYSYRFDVYPVDQCPMNAIQFEAAAKKRNCTGDSRYLCAPDKNLTHLIEFCTDRKKSLYKEGNCVRLEGTGDLNHYSCKDKFISGCPTSPFTDDEIYKYPTCLDINRDFKCFVFEKDCPEKFSYTTESYSDGSGGKTEESKNKGTPENGINANFAAVIGVLVTLSAVEGIIILMCCIKRKKEKGNPNDTGNDTQYRQLDVEKGGENRKMNEICNANGKEESTTKGLTLGQFLSYEKLTLSNIRCTVVGYKGAGMKTFLRSLENEIYKELNTSNSKYTVDKDINNSEVCEEKNPIQKSPITKNKQNHKGNKDWNGKNELSTEETKFLPKEDSKKKRKCKQLPHNHGKTSPKMNTESFINNITEEQDEEVITCLVTNFGYNYDEKSANSKMMDADDQLSIEKHVHSRIAFFECAEQTLFNVLHNIYFLQKTCFILVVDMTKSLDEQLCEENRDSRFKTWTYGDYYKFWLNSIKRFRGTRTPLIVVGTHADKLSQQRSSSFYEDFSETVGLRCFTDDIRFFVLGCPDTDSHLKELKNIKQCISSCIEDPEIISPMWAIFAYIFERQKTRKIISRGFFSNVNEQLRENDGLITEMLLFLHRIGTLLYFNSLNETIILDIPWFFEAFKLIIAHFMNKSDTERLQNKGKLDDMDLKLIWENSENKEYILHMPEILPCMEHLGLLAICNRESSNEGHGQWYYIPSMNKRKYENNDGTVAKSSILCFKFDEKGQTPSFLFNCLVIKCMKIPEWCIFEHRLYEHAACFSFRNHIVVMCHCKFQIQVQVRRMEKGIIDPNLLDQIQKSVEEKLKMNEELSFKTGYKCEHSEFNVEEDDLFISMDDISNSKNTCRKCTESDAHVDNTIFWEQKENNQPQLSESGKNLHEPTGVWISPYIPQNKIIFVAALDFGTTYSGIAWSFPWESGNKITCFMWSPSEQGCQATIKTPTVLLLNPNKELLAFGYEAEEEYNKLVAKNSHQEYYFFKNFKMFLYENENRSNSPFMKDAEGHTMHAKDVFGYCIKYMKNKLQEELKKTDNLIREENIMWVVTVPAIWNENANQFMTEAAMLAGIPQHQICLALEPEAASIHAKLLIDRKNDDHRQQNPVFKEKTKFILLDLGGGTVGISLKEISEGNNIKTIHNASGVPWGSLKINKELMIFFENLVGKQVLEELEQNHKAAWLDLEREIEDKKKNIGSDNDGPIRIQIPVELLELYVKKNSKTLREAIEANVDYNKKIWIERNFLCVDKSKSETFFKKPLSRITDHVKWILAKPEAAGLNHIVLVGGFAESKYIQDKLPKSLGCIHVFIPDEPWPAVLRGAVLLGLKLYKDENMN